MSTQPIPVGPVTQPYVPCIGPVSADGRCANCGARVETTGGWHARGVR